MAKGASKIGGGGGGVIQQQQPAQNANEAKRFSANEFDSVVDSYLQTALTAGKISDFADRIDASSTAGSTIDVTEPNQWHTITSSYVRQPDGSWHYVRQNRGTGDIYSDMRVNTRAVASEVLQTVGTDTWRWKFSL